MIMTDPTSIPIQIALNLVSIVAGASVVWGIFRQKIVALEATQVGLAVRQKETDVEVKVLQERGFNVICRADCQRAQALCRTEWKQDILDLRNDMSKRLDDFGRKMDGVQTDITNMKISLSGMASYEAIQRITRDQHPGFTGPIKS
jgi:hypothetical protein